MERSAADKTKAESRRERGVLLGSGFVGGEGLLGVFIAALVFILPERWKGFGTGWLGPDWLAMLIGTAAFAVFATWFVRLVRGRGTGN